MQELMKKLSQSFDLPASTLAKTALSILKEEKGAGLLWQILAEQSPDSSEMEVSQVKKEEESVSSTLIEKKKTSDILIEEEMNFESLYVENAGLVLIWPYMKLLFERLDLLEGEKFRDQAASFRAAHVLQFIVTGKTETPEHLLSLNKLLCGIPFSNPLSEGITLSDEETTLIEGLMQAVNQAWKPLSNSSIHALRETFLQREGMIIFETDRIVLKVERKSGVDALLESLPWSFSVISLPWLKKGIYVEW